MPPPGTPLTPVAARELDSAIALVRKYSLWRDTVTWPVVERDVRTAAAGAESPEDVYPAIRILLAALGDHHSYFIPPAEQQMLQRGTGAIVADVRALGDSVGYVAIPGYMEADRERTRAYVSRVYAGLEQFASTARCGWIVDLRRNTGGIGTPMLGALLPFLGRGLLGGNVLPIRGDSAPITWTQRWVAMDWMVQNGVDVTPPADLSALDTAYVAVITGPLTGSAGEIVTLAFHGRPHTRSFGEPTAGATTGGAVFALPDGARLAISAALYADRTGRSYDGPIQPDQLVPVGSAADGDEDAPIAAAERWLARSTGCNITAPHIGS